MHALQGFRSSIGSVAFVDDPKVLRARSRDWHTVSPLLRKALRGKYADAIVRPRDKGELFAVIRAAVRHRIPLTPRGGGTANYGQSVPLQGGVLVDFTQFAGVRFVEPGVARALAGTNTEELDTVARAHGWEQRLHPSTKRYATLGGFIAGGSGGVGGCTWGMLRDVGNILAVEVASVEEEPKLIELRGRDVERVHHAYGTTGFITEIEVPLAPAWIWSEALTAFPSFAQALDFALRLGHEDGVLKKLISLQEWPIPRLMPALGGVVPEGHTLVSTLVAEQSRRDLADLLAATGGILVSAHPEGQGPYGAPLYEFSYGHSLLQVQKGDPRYTSVQGLYPAPDLAGLIAGLQRAFAGRHPFRLEFQRSAGRLTAIGGPLFLYDDEAGMAAIVRTLQEAGAQVANSHTTAIQNVGVKRLTEADFAFKRLMDPHGLMNPGKLSLDAGDAKAFGNELPTSGWSFKS